MHDHRWFSVVVIGLTLSGCAQAAVRHQRPRTAQAPRNDDRPVEVARARPPAPPAPARPAATRADDAPLTAKIDNATPAGRSAALRLTEEGRQRLAAGDAPRAIDLLERAIAVDARVPYAYYFLAKAHADLHHPALAHRFLDRADQKLANEPYWRSQVNALRGQLLADEGRSAEAEAAYRRALDAWPGNRAAAEALTAASQRDKNP
ncbi:MAG: tetratricopeptide repeat protein [Candidatus Binatia bacterium]